MIVGTPGACAVGRAGSRVPLGGKDLHYDKDEAMEELRGITQPPALNSIMYLTVTAPIVNVGCCEHWCQTAGRQL